MGFLRDTDLRTKIGQGTLIEGLPSTGSSDVRGCAVDLHIGSIYRPGAETGKPGSATTPHLMQVTLSEGETAVIETIEKFKLDSQHAAFVLPASSVSVQGLLMTNPGHVDPGYQGSVHVTVINMGRKPYALVPKARFLRAFFYDLNAAAASPLTPTSVTGSRVTPELLERLSHDFLSVGERAGTAAKKEMDSVMKRSVWIQYGLPAVTTLIGAIAAAALSNYTLSARFDERLKTLEEAKAVDRLKDLEIRYPTAEKMYLLDKQVQEIKERLSVPPKPKK